MTTTTVATTPRAPPPSSSTDDETTAVTICLRVNHLFPATWDNDVDPSTLPQSWEHTSSLCPLPDLSDQALWKRLANALRRSANKLQCDFAVLPFPTLSDQEYQRLRAIYNDARGAFLKQGYEMSMRTEYRKRYGVLRCLTYDYRVVYFEFRQTCLATKSPPTVTAMAVTASSQQPMAIFGTPAF